MPFNEETEQANRKRFEEMLKLKSSTKRGLKSSTKRRRGTKTALPGVSVELTDYDFSQVIQSDPMVVVDFWAPWCAPCRIVSPMLEELASQYAGRVSFGKVNVDENPMVAAMFGIESIPTIMIFENGQPVDGEIDFYIDGDLFLNIIESKIRRYRDRGSPMSSPYQ